jgi:hypothetical protein
VFRRLGERGVITQEHARTNATRAEELLASLTGSGCCHPDFELAVILNQKAASRLHSRQRLRVFAGAHTPRLTDQDSRVLFPSTATCCRPLSSTALLAKSIMFNERLDFATLDLQAGSCLSGARSDRESSDRVCTRQANFACACKVFSDRDDECVGQIAKSVWS